MISVSDKDRQHRSTTSARAVAEPRAFPGRLVAITATGPVYESRVTGTLLPISCVLALHQELVSDPLAH
jgi:hypothetical protein